MSETMAIGWLTGTAPVWTAVALMYCITAVYLRAFNYYDHPVWVWGTFLFIGASMFLTINRQHIWGHESNVVAYVEVGTMLAFLIGGAVMLYLAIKYAETREKVEYYQQITDYYDEKTNSDDDD